MKGQFEILYDQALALHRQGRLRLRQHLGGIAAFAALVGHAWGEAGEDR